MGATLMLMRDPTAARPLLLLLLLPRHASVARPVFLQLLLSAEACHRRGTSVAAATAAAACHRREASAAAAAAAAAEACHAAHGPPVPKTTADDKSMGVREFRRRTHRQPLFRNFVGLALRVGETDGVF